MKTIAFARGVPAPEMLAVAQLRAASARAFERDPEGVLSYGTGVGYPPLQAHLAAQHDIDPTSVVVTPGSLQGFALLAQVLARRAKAEGRTARVIVEQPTYDRPLLILASLGIDVIAVPIDEHGVDVDELDAAMADGADLVYLIPTFQNPAGTTLPLERRRRVVELAARHGILVLEDDPYGLLHFDEPAPPTLYSMKGTAPIAFSGSFSKTIAPGLRVGWLVLPPELASEVSRLANDTYISASFLAQATVHEFLDAGELEPNLQRNRLLLGERRTLIERALDEHLPEASYVRPAGGYFIWVRLPHELDAAALVAAATPLGVSCIPGASFGLECERHVRLAFSSPPVGEIETGIRRLATACETVLAKA